MGMPGPDGATTDGAFFEADGASFTDDVVSTVKGDAPHAFKADEAVLGVERKDDADHVHDDRFSPLEDGDHAGPGPAFHQRSRAGPRQGGEARHAANVDDQKDVLAGDQEDEGLQPRQVGLLFDLDVVASLAADQEHRLRELVRPVPHSDGDLLAPSRLHAHPELTGLGKHPRRICEHPNPIVALNDPQISFAQRIILCP